MGLLIEDLATERSIRDIARSHEAVIDTAPAVAIPAAAAPARDYIFKVTVAVVLTHNFPRERCAGGPFFAHPKLDRRSAGFFEETPNCGTRKHRGRPAPAS